MKIKKKVKVIPKKEIKQQTPDESGDDSSSSSEESKINLAVNDMQFRHRRGERIQQLIMRNEMYENKEDEDFWNNNKYFNEVNKPSEQDDNESFHLEENEQKMDSYDSDFGKEDDSAAIVSDSNEDEEGKEKKVEIRKKIKKVQFHQSLEELTRGVKQEQIEEGKKYYIHEFFTQEELLKEGVETEVKNKESLNSLIMLEEERKKFNLKHRQEVEGTYLKMIYTQYKGDDFDDRPYTGIKSTAKLVNQQNGQMDFFSYLNKDAPLKRKTIHKYRDPLTKQGYNTIEEFKKIRRAHASKQRTKLQAQIFDVQKLI